MHDYMVCPGNICVTDPDNFLKNWYPDEAVCTYRPRPKWLKRQIKIQRLYLKGEIDDNKYFMLNDLEKIRLVRKGIKGSNPANVASVAKKIARAVRSIEIKNSLMSKTLLL